MRHNVRQVALAGLFHDIGKLYVRAHPTSRSYSQVGLEVLQKIFGKTAEQQEWLECIRYHHPAERPDDLSSDHPAYLLSAADYIAASGWVSELYAQVETMSIKPEKTAKVNGKSTHQVVKYRKNQEPPVKKSNKENCAERPIFPADKPLQSIFNRVHGRDGEEQVFSLCSLAEGTPNYPVAVGKAKVGMGQYQRLLKEMETAFSELSCEQNGLHVFLQVLETYTSYMLADAAQPDAEDISFFDHSRLTAGIACCLQAWLDEAGISDYKKYFQEISTAKFQKQSIFLLVSGDMSGIQEFIYTIPSKGALKGLRGRSFYLEFLIEHVVDELLAVLGLSRANLLYTGGGHFYLLAPNTKAARTGIAAIMQQVNQWLLEQVGTALYIQMASQEASSADLMNTPDGEGRYKNRTGELFKQLGARLSAGKLRRYQPDTLAALFSTGSSYNKVLHNTKECEICKTSSKQLQVNHLSGDGEICAHCAAMQLLGQKLLDEKVVLAVSDKPQENAISLPSGIDKPRYLLVLTTPTAIEYQKQGKLLRVYEKHSSRQAIAGSIRLFVGDYFAAAPDGSVLDFSRLASEGQGIKRLGVLRADVDFLGAVFIAGLMDEQSSEPFQYVNLVRTAVLSRQLSLFFKNFINHLCRGELPAGNGRQPFFAWADKNANESITRKVTVVYAGGDDMFLVGAWDELLQTSLDIRAAFRRFTAERLSFSAGFALFPHAFPVSQMAQQTGLLEQAAKDYPGKDAIALFGIAAQEACEHVYSWTEFADKVCQEKLTLLLMSKQFYQGEDQQAIGKAFLYRLNELLEALGTADGRINLARLAYMLARLMPGEKAAAEQQACYQKFREHIYQWALSDTDRRQLITALHLLVYYTRTQEDNG